MARKPDGVTTWHPGEPRAPFLTRSSDVRRCPTLRLDPQHYRPDGSCMCVPPHDESLEPHLIRGEN